MKKLFIFFCSTLLVLCSFANLGIKEYKLKTVVIDAGHGGKDPGCHGKISEEADVALAVALELGKKIQKEQPGIKVIYTRDTDEFIELHERARIANKNNANLFISIHCNSGPTTVSGTETYTMGLHTSEGNLEVAKRENAVVLKEDNYLAKYDGFDPNSPEAHILFSLFQHAHIDNSLKLASFVENEFTGTIKRKSRGVKQAGLLVLWKTTMPGVLIEIGFLTNKEEEVFLNAKDNQEKIASGIFQAFLKYKKDIEKN